MAKTVMVTQMSNQFQYRPSTLSITLSQRNKAIEIALYISPYVSPYRPNENISI